MYSKNMMQFLPKIILPEMEKNMLSMKNNVICIQISIHKKINEEIGIPKISKIISRIIPKNLISIHFIKM